MRAIDYFEKYGADIAIEFQQTAANDYKPILTAMIFQMFDEAEELCAVRKVKSRRGQENVYREISDKCNAVRSLMEKEYGIVPFARDVILKDFQDTLYSNDIKTVREYKNPTRRYNPYRRKARAR